MDVPTLSQCCCGCTLKIGSVSIAGFNIICGIYFLATGIVFLSHESTNDESVALVAAGGILATMGALVLLGGLTLFIGVMKEIRVLLIPYMVLAMLSAATHLITGIIAAVSLLKMDDYAQAASQIIVPILYLPLQTYFILVVYSLYEQQEDLVPLIGV